MVGKKSVNDMMIEAAVVLPAIDRHWPDFAIILFLLIANAVVGFWEENQAGNGKSFSTPTCSSADTLSA